MLCVSSHCSGSLSTPATVNIFDLGHSEDCLSHGDFNLLSLVTNGVYKFICSFTTGLYFLHVLDQARPCLEAAASLGLRPQTEQEKVN